MVARHTRRAGWRAASGCVCIDCGTRYLFTNTYKGNYCPDCHESWVARQRGDPAPTSTPLRTRATVTAPPDEGGEEDERDPDDPYHRA